MVINSLNSYHVSYFALKHFKDICIVKLEAENNYTLKVLVPWLLALGVKLGGAWCIILALAFV